MAASTNQDHRKKTLPLQTHESPQDEGEVIDGEIIDEDQPANSSGEKKARREPGQRSATRGNRRNEREQKRSQAWDERLGREEKERVDRGAAPKKPAEKPIPGSLHADGTRRRVDTPVAQLRMNVNQAGKQYMKNVRKAKIFAAKREPGERRSQLEGIHKGYVSMMVLSCVQPLSEGVNAKSVLSVVGMGTAMWTMSPNFRDQMRDFRDQMHETMLGKIDERKQSKIDKVKAKVGKKTANDKPLSERWQAKLERAERAERGGRDEYTAQSAGMTEVALTENAYAAMRVEGADVDLIRDEHDSMLKDLYAQAARDGVKPEELATAARVVVGLRLEEEPELASVFGELSHGQFAKSDPREVRLSGSEDTAQVWTGEFESRLGQPITGGSFGLRPPMDAAAHQAAIADTMTADMLALTREQGVDGLNVGVVSYAAAWGLRGHENYDAMTEMDNPLGERLRTTRLMLHTMDADNISSVEQQRVYSNAYVDALEMVGNLHPEMEVEWAAKFGENWRENMRAFVTDPQQFMGEPGGESAAEAEYEQESAGTAREAGPAAGHSAPGSTTAQRTEQSRKSAATARKYRAARINQNYIETTPTGLSGAGSDKSDHRDQDFELGG